MGQNFTLKILDIEIFKSTIRVYQNAYNSKLQRTKDISWIHLTGLQQVVLWHMHDQSWEIKKHHWTAYRQSASLYWKNEKDWKIDVKTTYKSFLLMVSWQERKKVCCLLKKKKTKTKLKNKQAEKLKHCPAAIMSSHRTLRLCIKNWMSSTFQRRKI